MSWRWVVVVVTCSKRWCLSYFMTIVSRNVWCQPSRTSHHYFCRSVFLGKMCLYGLAPFFVSHFLDSFFFHKKPGCRSSHSLMAINSLFLLKCLTPVVQAAEGRQKTQGEEIKSSEICFVQVQTLECLVLHQSWSWIILFLSNYIISNNIGSTTGRVGLKEIFRLW